MPSYTLKEIAERVGGRLVGDPARRLAAVRPLDAAGPHDLSFLANPRYRDEALASRAGALLLRDPDRIEGRDQVLVDHPYTALAAAMSLFHPERRPAPGVSDRAVVAADARLGRDVSIGPLAVVGARAVVGDRVVLMAGVILGDDVSLGAHSVLHPGVVVYAGSIVGARVTLHAGVVVGSDGFGFGEEGGGRAKIPQVGIVRIEDDVEVGANTTIDRATFGETVIGRGSRLDNLVQVAHNVHIGEGSVLVAQSGIAGSTRLGRSVIVAGQSGVAGHLTVGDGAVVGAKSAVLADLPAGAFVVGHPAIAHRDWKRAQAAWRRLPDLLRTVQRLEALLGASTPAPAPRKGGAARRGTTRKSRGTRRRAR
ncbi:MAG TPA: UDP-3-O-(3-hydroxymyristoyl)glucosamine N-acyltransferase [Candidatus Polarisedimenticolia bacterium]|nr:UDP-3-O-(3-hydroxymyristoyl)glucosamine N-acyltransferase [Candidatus Polarisedimenticolia bacterium]